MRCRAMPGWLAISGRFVGDAYMRPVRFARYIALSVWLQRAAYMPPLRITHKFGVAIMSRAGHAPPLRGGEFYCPVGRGDLTPPGKWAVAANFPLISRLRRQLPPQGEALTFLHFDFTNFTILLQERGFFCKSFTAIVHAHGRSGAETALQ